LKSCVKFFKVYLMKDSEKEDYDEHDNLIKYSEIGENVSLEQYKFSNTHGIKTFIIILLIIILFLMVYMLFEPEDVIQNFEFPSWMRDRNRFYVFNRNHIHEIFNTIFISLSIILSSCIICLTILFSKEK